MNRPQLRLVLAVSLDGRLAPPVGGAAQLGGAADRRVLEEALAWADGALLGAGTLRSHGCTCLIHAEPLLAVRRRQGLGDQPIAIVASRAGVLDPELPFFRQPLQRWLLRSAAGSAQAEGFDQVLPLGSWPAALQGLASLGVRRLVVLGGADLASALLDQGLIDELQLTLTPLLLGGPHHWSQAMPRAAVGRHWRLLEARPLGGEELLVRYGRASSD
ncbi:MAG: dihydrofolate reductase family protein [Cyanobacteriota bacterium]|nr:dihydrofolate reductase family protein [Cyanobacteriota bacterium]